LLDQGQYLPATEGGGVWLCPANERLHSYKQTYVYFTDHEGISLDALGRRFVRTDENWARKGFIYNGLIWDNYALTPYPSGELVAPPYMWYRPPEEWLGPHRYDKRKGNPAVDGYGDDTHLGDFGCIDVLWNDLHVGAARPFNGGWEYLEYLQ
jgi:hypothetical protein